MRAFIFTLLILITVLTSAAHAAETWRGFHCSAPSHADVPKMKKLIPELASLHVNVLVLEVNYDYQFQSHPELALATGMNRADAQELLAVCRANGVRLIPGFECIGHQSANSAGAKPGPLLKAHPEFDAAPEISQDDPKIYCREWNAADDRVYPIVFELMDELIADFGADAMHCGMDEIFLLKESGGKTKPEIFAAAITRVHDHLAAKNVETIMWADRLIDPSVTNYGNWEESGNGLWPAVDLIPKDIIVSPWHYEKKDAYPSPRWLMEKGFRVWPAPWKDRNAAVALLHQAAKDAAATGHPERNLGALFTTWVRPNLYTIVPGGSTGQDEKILNDVYATVQDGMRELGEKMPPYAPAIGGEMAYTPDGAASVSISGGEGETIRYTMDGSDVTTESPAYAGPLKIATPTTLMARAWNESGRSMFSSARIAGTKWQDAEKLDEAEPGVLATIFHGDFRKIADLGAAMPEDSARQPDFALTLGAHGDHFAILFTGYLDVKTEGVYRFVLTSDDGSVLKINNEVIVDNDGLHGEQERDGSVALRAGLHPYALNYFEGTGDELLRVEWEGPGIPRQEIEKDSLKCAKIFGPEL
ncbi:hypothetical protein BH09SUM1_BH09SUM1_18580 [soil metagenome]